MSQHGKISVLKAIHFFHGESNFSPSSLGPKTGQSWGPEAIIFLLAGTGQILRLRWRAVPRQQYESRTCILAAVGGLPRQLTEDRSGKLCEKPFPTFSKSQSWAVRVATRATKNEARAAHLRHVPLLECFQAFVVDGCVEHGVVFADASVVYEIFIERTGGTGLLRALLPVLDGLNIFTVATA